MNFPLLVKMDIDSMIVKVRMDLVNTTKKNILSYEMILMKCTERDF